MKQRKKPAAKKKPAKKTVKPLEYVVVLPNGNHEFHNCNILMLPPGELEGLAVQIAKQLGLLNPKL